MRSWRQIRDQICEEKPEVIDKSEDEQSHLLKELREVLLNIRAFLPVLGLEVTQTDQTVSK